MTGYVANVGPLRDFRLKDMTFPGSRLAFGIFEEVTFERIQFRRVDLRTAQLRRCRSEASFFESIMLDKSTLLDISGADANLDFSGLRYASEDGVRTLYEPAEVLTVLRAAKLPHAEVLSEPVVRKVASEVVNVIESYLKASSRMNPLCVSENPYEFHPDKVLWARITKIGEEAGVLRTEYRQARGPRNLFVRRLFRAEDIMKGMIVDSGANSEIEKFWVGLERES